MTAPFMAYDDALSLIETFERTLETEALWTGKTPMEHRSLRLTMWHALEALTVWHRPWLEAGPGLDAPSAWVRRTLPLLERCTVENPNPYVREQALLYLTLLPYPGQWRRLEACRMEAFGQREPPVGASVFRADGSGSGQGSELDAEITGFFRKERQKLHRKLQEKSDRIFKVRHFIQVLKKPKKDGEKGVLRLFSLPYLLTDKEFLSRISQRFVFFVEPPMGVVWRHSWWRLFCEFRDPCLFGVGGPEDAAFLKTQGGAFPVPLAHGDFLEDLNLVLEDGPKHFDIVFNATFDDMERKRHGLMLDLLTRPELSKKTALFVGRGSPDNVALFQREIEIRSLKSRVVVAANVRRADIPGLLARCRLGVHLSLYENACRAVMEYFRSNIPCVVSSSMAGMRPEIFNEETGAAVPDAHLAETIAEALENIHRYAPRRWFVRESGSRVSSARLNALVKGFFLERGMPWTENMVLLKSSGASRYASADDEARFRDEHVWVAELLQGVMPEGFQVIP